MIGGRYKERDIAIVTAVLNGARLGMVAKAFGLSVPRVQQIVLGFCMRTNPNKYDEMMKAGRLKRQEMRDLLDWMRAKMNGTPWQKCEHRDSVDCQGGGTSLKWLREHKDAFLGEVQKPAITPASTIDDLQMGCRITNALLAEGIETVDQLLRRGPLDVFLIENIGRKSLNIIRSALAVHGLKLQGDRGE